MPATQYVLVHRITRVKLPLPWVFPSMTAGNLFCLVNDLHADAVPASGDLFGAIVPDFARATV